MITDPLSIQFSSARRYQTVVADQLYVISAFAEMLPDCGWDLTDSYFATAIIDYPLGFPTVTGPPITPKRTVGCSSPAFVTIGSAGFVPYNPFSEQPPGLATCYFFAMDTTDLGGLINLASAVTAATMFDATAEHVSGTHYRLNLVAKIPGPVANFQNIQGDGRWGVGSGLSSGGGYQWESAAGAATYRVAITAQIAQAAITFDFLINGNLPMQRYRLNQNGQPTAGTDPGHYAIVCNGYGFGIWDGPDFVSGAAFRVVSLFCMAPYRPPSTDPQIPQYEVFNTSAYAVFILGPGSFRAQTTWYTPLITTALDADANTYANQGGWPRLLAFRAPGPPLLTQSGVPLVICAYVEFGSGPLSSANIIGKLYDCAVMHQQVGGIMIIQGQRFVPVSTQPGNSGNTASTLMMCIPAANEGASGTCIFNTTQVIKVSGPAWTADMVGGPITIAGIPYIVTQFIDSSHIVVNAFVSTLIVPWSIP